MESVVLVLGREELGDEDSLGAGALLDAVATGGAGDEVFLVDDVTYLLNCFLLAFVEGLEVLHGKDIVLHLLQIAHTRQHHRHHGETARKAHGVAGIGTSMQVAQDLVGLGWQVHQAAALDGLHHNDGFLVLRANFIHLAALDGVRFVVGIVELYLHHLHLRMLGEDHVEYLVLVVERDAEMAYLAFLLQLPCCFVSLALLELQVVVAVLGMHEVEVEIIHFAPCQLLLEEGTDVLLLVEEGVGELVGQQELAAVEAFRDAICDGSLRLAAVVAVRCVEIVESGSNESIGHAAKLIVVDGSAFLLRKSHATESEVAVYFRKERI